MSKYEFEKRVKPQKGRTHKLYPKQGFLTSILLEAGLPVVKDISYFHLFEPVEYKVYVYFNLKFVPERTQTEPIQLELVSLVSVVLRTWQRKVLGNE